MAQDQIWRAERPDEVMDNCRTRQRKQARYLEKGM